LNHYQVHVLAGLTDELSCPAGSLVLTRVANDMSSRSIKWKWSIKPQFRRAKLLRDSRPVFASVLSYFIFMVVILFNLESFDPIVMVICSSVLFIFSIFFAVQAARVMWVSTVDARGVPFSYLREEGRGEYLVGLLCVIGCITYISKSFLFIGEYTLRGVALSAFGGIWLVKMFILAHQAFLALLHSVASWQKFGSNGAFELTLPQVLDRGEIV
jgi:hypothetical protein